MTLIAGQMIERGVPALVFLIDQHRMALRERAALGVLPREPHVAALLQQRAERQRLAGRPVYAKTAVDRLGPVVEEPLDGAVNPETVRHPGDLAADFFEDRDVDAGNAPTGIFFLVGNLETGPFAVQPVGLVGLVAGAGFEFGVKPR